MGNFCSWGWGVWGCVCGRGNSWKIWEKKWNSVELCTSFSDWRTYGLTDWNMEQPRCIISSDFARSKVITFMITCYVRHPIFFIDVIWMLLLWHRYSPTSLTFPRYNSFVMSCRNIFGMVCRVSISFVYYAHTQVTQVTGRRRGCLKISKGFIYFVNFDNILLSFDHILLAWVWGCSVDDDLANLLLFPC